MLTFNFINHIAISYNFTECRQSSEILDASLKKISVYLFLSPKDKDKDMRIFILFKDSEDFQSLTVGLMCEGIIEEDNYYRNFYNYLNNFDAISAFETGARILNN